jgi:hypothetical protein
VHELLLQARDHDSRTATTLEQYNNTHIFDLKRSTSSYGPRVAIAFTSRLFLIERDRGGSFIQSLNTHEKSDQ